MSGVMSELTGDILWNTLVTDYNNFFVPSFAVKVGAAPGASADQNLLSLNPPVAVYNVSVDRAINEAGSFSFTVDNPYSLEGSGKKFPRLEKDSPFQPGVKVVIELGYSSNLKPVITGTIDSVEVSFEANGLSSLTIKGYDFLQPLMKEKKTVPSSWGTPDKQIAYSDIVKDIVKKYNLKDTEVEDTKQTFSSVKNQGNNDFEFIKGKLAVEVGFEVYVRGDVFHFHKPRMDKAAEIKSLEWGKSLISFSPRLDVSGQVTSVEVKGWDPDTQSAVVGTAAAGNESNRGRGQSGSEIAQSSGSTATERIWRAELRTQGEAQKYAQAVLEKRSQKLLTGSGECIGLPEIEPGLKVDIKGLGTRFDKSYYMTKVTHSISSSGFKTQFTVTENTLP